MIRFVRSELKHIALSVAVLAVAISGIGVLPIDKVGQRLLLIVFPLAVGFLAHEFAHKYVARSYGYFSIYRAWNLGLLLALCLGLLTGGRIIFAAPGAVVILAPFITLRQSALVSLAGPLTNIAVACVFFPLSFLGGALGLMGMLGAYINLWLAFFNLLPLPPLDGSKVVIWRPDVWIAVEVPLMAAIFMLW
jgi:Zn-dependent protease